MAQFDCPRHCKPSLSSISDIGRIPFSHLWSPSMNKKQIENFLNKMGFKAFRMVQFDRPRIQLGYQWINHVAFMQCFLLNQGVLRLALRDGQMAIVIDIPYLESTL